MTDLRIVDAPVLLQESITDDVKMPTGGLGNFSVRLGDIVWYVVTKEQLANKNYVDLSSKGVKDSLDEHIADKANPHQVTKAQVGLGNVDNTSDLDKPISEATNAALFLKSDKSDTYNKTEVDTKVNAVSGGYIGAFATLSDLQAKTGMTTGQVAKVMNDPTTTNNGDYRYTGSAWAKGYSPVDDAKSYIDTKSADLTNYVTSKTQNIATQPDALLDTAEDKDGNMYRYTTADGGLNIVGLSGSVQTNIGDLKKTANTTQTDNIIKFDVDAVGQVVSYYDKDGTPHFLNDIYINEQSVLTLINNNTTANTTTNSVIEVNRNAFMYQQAMLSSQAAIKTIVPIAQFDEDNLIKRMPSAIKTPTGLVYFYHKQIAGYDGDSTGSELWKAIVNIDANLNVTVQSRELFLAPDQLKGVIKHPMLGRTSDNRIILIYEKRLEKTDPYVRYQCYSSDEGVTWTTPTVISPSGTAAYSSMALGSTGTIVTAKNGRLICPMYSTNNLVFVMYSDNDGQTWTYSDTVAPYAFRGQEPAVTLDLDDNLIMSIRPVYAGTRLFAKSTDNGITWKSITVSPSVPSTGVEGSIYRDTKLRTIMISHDSTGTDTRAKLRLYLSYDNGKSFPFYYQPLPDNWYTGYNQIIKWSEGVYIIVLEYSESKRGDDSGLIILSAKEVLSHVNYY